MLYHQGWKSSSHSYTWSVYSNWLLWLSYFVITTHEYRHFSSTPLFSLFLSLVLWNCLDEHIIGIFYKEVKYSDATEIFSPNWYIFCELVLGLKSLIHILFYTTCYSILYVLLPNFKSCMNLSCHNKKAFCKVVCISFHSIQQVQFLHPYETFSFCLGLPSCRGQFCIKLVGRTGLGSLIYLYTQDYPCKFMMRHGVWKIKCHKE